MTVKKMIKLGFKVDSIGFEYWLEAMNIYKNGISMTDLYKAIAEKYNTDYKRVERCMRHCSSNAIENIKKESKYKDKVTTKTVLELVKYKQIIKK